MKATPWILLVTITIYTAKLGAAHPSIASKPGFVFDKDKLLEDFNKHRREFAKEKNFAKMFKLEWDDELASKAKDKKTSVEEYRYYHDMPKTSDMRSHMEDVYASYLKNETLLKKEASVKKVSVHFHEVLVSGQKKVGCAVGLYRRISASEGNKNWFYWGFGMMCLLAPERDLKSYDSHKGEAGSQCDGDYKNDDGLCVLNTETSTDSSTSSQNSGDITVIVVACVAGIVLVVIVIAVTCIILRRKKGNDQGGKTTATGTGTATGTTKGTTRTKTTKTATGRY